MTPQTQQILDTCDSINRLNKLYEELETAMAEVGRITNAIKRERE